MPVLCRWSDHPTRHRIAGHRHTGLRVGASDSSRPGSSLSDRGTTDGVKMAITSLDNMLGLDTVRKHEVEEEGARIVMSDDEAAR